jgi:hypothetical protein
MIFEAAAAAWADVLSLGFLLCVNALPATFLASGLDAGLSNTLEAILPIFEFVPFFISLPPKVSATLPQV